MQDFVPNERLRRARSLKGWSQAELAAEIGTSFEMVSRWERGVILPSPYYRVRLCAALGQTADDLGLLADTSMPSASPAAQLMVLVSAHVDAANPVVTVLRTLLEDRKITLMRSSQLSRQGGEHARAALRNTMQAATGIVAIISPDTRRSRRVREAFALAALQRLPVYGIWIAGDRWTDCLPDENVQIVGPIDARAGNALDALREMVAAVAQTPSPSVAAPISRGEALPVAAASAAALPSPIGWSEHFVGRTAPRASARPYQRLLAVVIIAVLLGTVGAADGSGAAHAVRGGTWIEAIHDDPLSLIPNGAPGGELIDQALYLPLFYGGPDGLIHPGAATEVPTLHNGGISADGQIWTFHFRPHLVWSDGEPYDARDVDYTWRLWVNPAFGATNADGDGLSLIRTAAVSADHLSITFHLTRPYAPFLQYWVDGSLAPLPAHHFRSMAPATIQQSADNLDPTITSGPFMMQESVPGDHYTVVRNPRYYLASAGLPYLDAVVFRVASEESAYLELRAGTITSTAGLDLSKLPLYQRLAKYQLVIPPVSAAFEALFFNLHNVILASHPEVRQAMALAIDRNALVKGARQGFATALCTDHPSGIHPGYGPASLKDCPEFDLTAANKLLEDSGWVKGPDGVRAKDGQRLEFEYSTTANVAWRDKTQAMVQHTFMEIGIKLDVQNYGTEIFFNTFLPAGKASPPTGAVAGDYDLVEYGNQFGYDPDESFLLACDQIPPNGQNFSFYCNAALDSLYDQELTTVEPGTRQKLFTFIHNIYLADLPFIVLYSTTDVAIAAKGTHNYVPSPIAGSTVNIWNWWCDQGICPGSRTSS